MSAQRWVLVYERETTHAGGRSTVPVGIPVQIGQKVLVGREGDLPLGVEVYNSGISRRAVQVAATGRGWEVEVLNRSGAVVHPWGQHPAMASGFSVLSWPRIAIRVLNGATTGESNGSQHWLLLESDTISVTPTGARASSNPSTSTFQPAPPIPLTAEQLDALHAVFADQLQWPPPQQVEPPLQRAAARMLDISEAGLRKRLERAHERALRLGLHRPVGLLDPEYLYSLVRAGYIPLPTARLYRRQLP